jgi:hypothetical protein
MTNLISGKNVYLKKEGMANRRESQMKNRDEGLFDEGVRKVTIKNFLFS